MLYKKNDVPYLQMTGLKSKQIDYMNLKYVNQGLVPKICQSPYRWIPEVCRVS